MALYDEQLRDRRINDEKAFEDAFAGIAGAVMGRRLYVALEQKELAQNAVKDLLRYFHIKDKELEIPDGITDPAEQLEYSMNPYGIMYRTCTLSEDFYKDAVGPYFATLKENGSFVLLLPGKVSGYYFCDYETGRKIRVNRKTRQLLDDEAIVFYKPLPLKSLKIRDLLLFMASTYSFSDAAILIAAMLLSTLFGLLIPNINKLLFGEVIQSGSIRVLLSIAVFSLCVGLSRTLMKITEDLVNARIEVKQTTAVDAAVMARVIHLPPSFFKRYGSGELSQRSCYVNDLCRTLINTIVGTGLPSLMSLINITQIFKFAPGLVAPSLGIILVTIAFSLISTLVQMRITQKQMLVSTKERGMSYATIRGIRKIKLAGAERRAFARWAGLFAEKAGYTYNPPMIIKLNPAISLAISLAGTLIMYGCAISEGLSVADYYAFTAAYGMLAGAFSSLASIVITIATIKPIVEMAKPILDEVPEIEEGKQIVTKLGGSVELSHISFRYNDSMPYVLDDFSLKIRRGEYVAIVGKTGCGKSTLVRLLLGFETTDKGAIYYDGKDLSKLDVRSLRRKIGNVMQNGTLFTGDIFSNITITAPELNLDDAWEAAETAGIADDIREMPMGMNTIILEGAGGISGGQKQRLMIARAVAPKPKILIFDEATSALDNITQKHVSEAIDRMGCTRIVVAHRLSTIRNSDRIVVLDGGKIVEQGSYDELMAANGFFAELVERQKV